MWKENFKKNVPFWFKIGEKRRAFNRHFWRSFGSMEKWESRVFRMIEWLIFHIGIQQFLLNLLPLASLSVM